MVKAIPDILAQIIEQKKLELLQRDDDIEGRAEESMADRRDFARALTSCAPRIIAEIKQASPSRGILADEFDPVELAGEYEEGGAAALSVLTDKKYFHGNLAHLESARASVRLPVLRKDFTIDPYHVYEAAAHTADAILLIAAVLTEREMRDFRELAERLGMAALVEVHSEEDLKPAVDSGARIIGVNNRDLRTFQVDITVSLRLADKIPSDAIKVAESGIQTARDIAKLRAAGYHSFLIGEHLMRSGDPVGALRTLLS